MRKYLNLPNLLSAVRVLLGLALIELIPRRRHQLAFAALAIGEISDPLDGAIARKLGIDNGPFGEIFDLVGDSALTFGSVLGLVRNNDVTIQTAAGFAAISAVTQFGIEDRTPLPLMLMGSISYYLAVTTLLARRAGMSHRQLVVYGLCFLAFFRATDWERLGTLVHG